MNPLRALTGVGQVAQPIADGADDGSDALTGPFERFLSTLDRKRRAIAPVVR